MDDLLARVRARLRRPLARLQQGKEADWYRLQNKAGEPAALYIYDEIGYFGQTAKGLADDLRATDATELAVHVNSPGGDIFDGLAIYQALKDHPANVTVHVDGLAASIASVIAMAGDRVVMAPKASMMIHDGWTVSAGNAADLRKTADLLDKQSDIIASVYADRSNQPAGFWRDLMREETWYNADEALAAGLVDEIEGKAKQADDPFDMSVFAHAGRENAPAPALKPPTPEVVEPPTPPTPVVEDKTDEPAPFTWDFAAFKAALQEGVK
jgi:ATP-dependent protease ClpP protease subunit